MNQPPSSFKSGFLTIVGQPNVGKSTLLNQILGEKIAITSPKPQTTRDRIVGIKHLPGAQIVFLDTPGIHDAKSSKLNEVMVQQAVATLSQVDGILLVIDAAWQVAKDPATPLAGDVAILDAIRAAGSRPVILVPNKVDKVDKASLLPLIDGWQRLHPFAAVVPLSAKDGANVERLLPAITALLREGPPFYPDDMVTDRSLRFLMAEIIREKVFLQLGQELPYAIAVEVEAWEETDTLVRISAAIHVERETQKKIVIGAKGARAKAIGTAARLDMEAFLEKKVFLELYVRVEEDWTQKRRSLDRFGYVVEKK
ncbi:MAG: GTPase Era [Myxococcales bacterium]